MSRSCAADGLQLLEQFNHSELLSGNCDFCVLCVKMVTSSGQWTVSSGGINENDFFAASGELNQDALTVDKLSIVLLRTRLKTIVMHSH